MVEVAYNREHILECVKRWVKPAEEVRKHMEEVIGRCTRAPEAFLALRLPVKGSSLAAEPEELSAVEEATPVQEKERKSVKYVKKAPVSALGKKDESQESAGKQAEVNGAKSTSPAASTPTQLAPLNEKKDDVPPSVGGLDGSADAPETTESGRPRRAVRKSVRISEG